MNLSGSFTDKYTQIRRASTAWGGTNFQSLIDLIVRTRKENPSIPLEDFPKTLLVISDMQFNPSGYGSYGRGAERTNYEEAMKKLRTVFPEEFVKDFKMIWWYCSNARTTDFPSTMDDAGTYMVSGFDGAIISFLLGGEEIKVENNKAMPSMEDIVNAALGQEVLALIK